jgi:hypothetical protein
LDNEIVGYVRVLKEITPRIGRLNLIEVEYTLAMRNAERRWVAQIMEDLRNGKLNWNQTKLRKEAARFLCAGPPPQHEPE